MAEFIANGLLEVGGTYLFQNYANQNYALNVWCSNAYPANPLSNVCLWETNPNDTAQRWKLIKDSNGHYLLQSEENPATYLDLYTGGGTGANVNAHLFTPSSTSYLSIDSASYGCVTIKLLTRPNLCLTGNPNSHGSNTGKTKGANGNVYFDIYSSSRNDQLWKPLMVSSNPQDQLAPPTNIESVNIMRRYTAPLPFTGYTITIKNVEDNSSTEKYHRGSGFRPSEEGKNLINTRDGAAVLSTLKSFAKEVYLHEALKDPKNNADEIRRINEALTKSRYAYYLFGEYDSSAKYHHGVDFKIEDSHPIYAFWGGEVVKRDDDGYGRIQIYVPEFNVTTIYMHMKNIPVGISEGSTIEAGTLLGYQSNVSPYTIGSHLHFEVRKGRSSSAGDNNASSSSKALTSIIPYGYMKKYDGQ